MKPLHPSFGGFSSFILTSLAYIRLGLTLHLGLEMPSVKAQLMSLAPTKQFHHIRGLSLLRQARPNLELKL
jgi:hypothetical protein